MCSWAEYTWSNKPDWKPRHDEWSLVHVWRLVTPALVAERLASHASVVGDTGERTGRGRRGRDTCAR
jgi:hypothetical protein